jgi:hypothetical protein
MGMPHIAASTARRSIARRFSSSEVNGFAAVCVLVFLALPEGSDGCFEEANKLITNSPATALRAVARGMMCFIVVVLHWVCLGTIVHAAEISKWKKYQFKQEIFIGYVQGG